MRKYELATSLHFRYDRECKIPLSHEIERITSCGFKNLDFNFLDMCMNRNSDFLKDNYIDWIKDCKKTGDLCGAKFVQAHAPCESIYDTGNYDLLVELCIKAIKGCAILGIPWMVYHPIPDCKGRFNSDEDIYEFNYKFFTTILPYAKEYNVGIAIEDIAPMYTNSSMANLTDDLIHLVDALGSSYVGVCWDVGHANLCSVISGAEHIAHQSEQIIKLGDRLKCTHIHDNNSKRAAGLGYKMDSDPQKIKWNDACVFDEHIQPFMGDIDWQDVIKGLDAIDYSHYFTYEAHHAANTLPENLVNSELVQLWKIGEEILSMSRL